MVKRFYSVGVISQDQTTERYGAGYSTATSTKYNLNEVVKHEYNEGDQFKEDYWILLIVLLIIGAGIGVFASLVIFENEFLSFWFFFFVVIGLIGGVIGYSVNMEDSGITAIARKERAGRGFTSPSFITVKEEEWDTFLKSLK